MKKDFPLTVTDVVLKRLLTNYFLTVNLENDYLHSTASGTWKVELVEHEKAQRAYKGLKV